MGGETRESGNIFSPINSTHLWNSVGGWMSRWKSFSLHTWRSRWCTAHLKLRLRFPLIYKIDNQQKWLSSIFQRKKKEARSDKIFFGPIRSYRVNTKGLSLSKKKTPPRRYQKIVGVWFPIFLFFYFFFSLSSSFSFFFFLWVRGDTVIWTAKQSGTVHNTIENDRRKWRLIESAGQQRAGLLIK